MDNQGSNTLFFTTLLLAIGNLIPLAIFSQQFQSSHLPIVVIQTNGATIKDDPKILVRMGIIDNENGINSINDPYNGYDGNIGIEFRGNSTQSFDKKSYGIELRDDNGEDQNASLLGMPEEEDWILYGSPIDKSHLRNVMTFELWRKMGYWASHTRYCELVIDGEYQGIYMLMEKIKRDKNRLNIAKLTQDETEGDDLTGGYIIRMDWPEGEGWFSQYNSLEGDQLYFQYYYPKSNEIVNSQQQYIQQYLTTFEDALYGHNFTNTKGESYTDFIDLNTFVDLFIINELSRSVDAYKLSSFLHKDKDSKDGRLKAGPIWDFNLAYGNTVYCGATSTNGWTYMQDDPGCDDLYLMPLWWERLMEDCTFRNTLYSRWEMLRQDFLNEAFLFPFIDQQVTQLGEAIDRNFERWDYLGENMWDEPFPVLESHAQEIARLKDWLKNRISWLDRQLSGECLTTATNFPLSGEIAVFPNPATWRLTVLFPEKENMTVRILDLNGRALITAEDVSEQLILTNFGILAAGMYIVELSKDGFLHSEPVLKYE